MIKQILSLSFAICATIGYSQTSNSNPWPTTGKVGIGTTSPAFKLQVLSNSTTSFGSYSETIASIGFKSASSLHFETYGNSGFATPVGQPEIPGNNMLRLQMNDASAKVGFIEFNSQPTTNSTKAAVTFGTNGIEAMRIAQTGKIRIGSGTSDIKTPDGYKLFVEEGILTEKVKVAVKTTANWADYVFAEDYKLMPLNEVEQFTKSNKRLPNVASAEEMTINGLDVVQMDAKLLEKVEELTLYLIEQNKINEKQAKEIEELKAMVKVLADKK